MRILSYHRRLFQMALRDPLKVPTMMRLKWVKNTDWRRADLTGRDRISPPRVIAVRPTQACNLRCVMCPQWGDKGVFLKEPQLAKRTVTTEEIKAFIDDVAPFRPYLYFSGGEPLLNKDLPELIRHASSRHLVTSLNTNGSYLKDMAEPLIRSGLDYLYTSLDAPAVTSNNLIRPDTGGGGSYEDAVDGIREVLKLRDRIGQGLPIVQAKTTLVEENQHLLLDMANFVQNDLRVDMWGVGLCVHTTEELDRRTTDTFMSEFGQRQVHWGGFIRTFSGMDYADIQRQYETILRTPWNFVLRLDKPMGMPGFDWKKYHEAPGEDPAEGEMRCMNPYVFAQMQPNGDLAFCGSQPDYAFGNIRSGRFLDHWNGEKANKWRRFLRNELFASCKRCWSLQEYSRFKG